MKKHLLEVKNLVTEFKQDKGILKAVNGVSYFLDEGEIIAFVGESGSGKSVTQYSGLQLIPTPPGNIAGGEILLNGQNVLDFGKNSNEMRKIRGGQMGVVFQEPMSSLNPIMTVGKQIEESIKMHLNLSKNEIKLKTIELLENVGIPDAKSRIKDYPHQFSGGMRQRIMIAMALACNPKILIADEATTALDVTTQAQILELMKEIVETSNTALIMVTHNLSIVARYAHRVYVMYAGEIVESGTTTEIFKNPRHPYTIGLLKAVPSLTDPKDRKLIPIDGFVKNLINRKDQCGFLERCPYRTIECSNSPTPQILGIDGDNKHMCRCHRIIDRNSQQTVELSSTDRQEIKKKWNFDDSKPIMRIENMKVYYPVTKGLLKKKVNDVRAVDNVSFDVYKGETFGLVGESGCGKSTIARAIMGLNEVTEGTIHFNGNNITNLDDKTMRPHRQHMSMIFQDPYGSLDPRQRAGDIVMEPLKNYHKNMTRREMDDKVTELFQLVGLDPAYRERVPHEFSGGQRQRLVIARALSTNPSFIVCDEAISALDVSIQAQVINLLEELQQKLGLTYLFIAHDLSVVRHISDRVAVMYLGEVVEIADWQSLYTKPLHPYTKALLAAVPVPDPEVESMRRKVVIQGEIPSPMNRPKGCNFSTRCPFANEKCKLENPTLEQQRSGHYAACYRIKEIDELNDVSSVNE